MAAAARKEIEARVGRGITPGALWRFGRPHTLIGTSLSIVSVSACGVDEPAQLVYGPAAAAVAVALVASLLQNVYIVGLNQMTDVEIDRINKPFLPVASGELSVREGWGLVVGCGVVSVALGVWWGSAPLLWTLLASMALGTAYSVPPIRLKRFPFFAALCILAVRGVIVQVGFFAHVREALGDEVGLALPAPVTFGVAFVTLFAVVIALFKDLPDVDGDAKHGVRTLSVRMGIPTVFRVCVALLLVDYALGVAQGLRSSVPWSAAVTCSFHALAAAVVAQRASRVDTADHSSVTAFYMFVWKLFYAEYLVLPFIR